MKHCEQCNLDFPEHFRFCGACGGALSDSQRCPSCGELSDTKRPLCTNCGRKLSADSPQSVAARTSELPSQPVVSALPDGAKALTPSTQEPETTTRYTEPGELYGADVYRESAAPPPNSSEGVDDSETAEIRRDCGQHYPTANPAEQAAPVARGYSYRINYPLPKTTVAAPSATGVKSAPTLSMMESYGDISEASAQFRWWQGVILALIVLGFMGGVGFGGWYWWSHRSAAAQPPVETAKPNEGQLSQERSVSPTTKPTSSIQPATVRGADEELKLLRDRRAKAQPSETNQIVAAITAAEKKYPQDYRFPYERAKLSITGVTTHHEAFSALALAAEKATEYGKAEEMLDSLNADAAGDFFKLSHGHPEWRTLQEALRNKDTAALKALHH